MEVLESTNGDDAAPVPVEVEDNNVCGGQAAQVAVCWNEDEDEDGPCCRICRQGEEAGKLYCPCRCAGSIKWIHESCLQAWLRGQARKPVCELCKYNFDFIPVYSKNAPQRLTFADWAGALFYSTIAVAHRSLRIAYAAVLWGFMLPLLTVTATRYIFGGRSRHPTWQVLSIVQDIFSGECLSLAGIAFIYFLSLLSVARGSVSSRDEQPPPLEVAIIQPPPTDQGTETAGSVERSVDLLIPEEPIDAEEDLWNVMGLQGNPWRSFLSMLTFFCANVLGICIFLAFPFFLGRSTFLWILLPQLKALAAEEASGWTSLASSELLLPGLSPLMDLCTLGLGYVTVSVITVAILLLSVLFSTAAGLGGSSQALRAFSDNFMVQMCEVVRDLWLKMQFLSAMALQLLLVPCCVGHVVACYLCGPVLHISQQSRASMANDHIASTLGLQLFLGYMHLWFSAFIESCMTDILMPTVVRRASSNFFIGAICSHRRLFGLGMGSAGFGPMPPLHWRSGLKLMLVLVSFHTLVAFLLWSVPARLLDRFLGQSLFPLNVLESYKGNSSSDKGEPDSQPYLAIEILQLYFLVLQCIRVLEASSGLGRLIVCTLSVALRSLGLGHLMVAARPDLALPAAAAATPVVAVAEETATPVVAAAATPEAPAATAATATSSTWATAETSATAPGSPKASTSETSATAPTAAALTSPGATTQTSSSTAAAQTPAAPATAESTLPEALAGSPAEPTVPSSSIDATSNTPPTTATATTTAPPASHSSPSSSSSLSSTSLSALAPSERPLQVFLRLIRPIRQVLVVASLIVFLSWVIIVVILAVPLTVGRQLVRFVLSAQASRISDFLPLSLGIVLVSGCILGVTKICEAMPAVARQVGQLGRGRFLRVAACFNSALLMAFVVLLVIPLGFGTGALRLVLPMKSQTVYQVPIVFLVTDCWSLGLVMSKVMWRLLQSDVILHGLHHEFMAIWNNAQGSVTNLLFDLPAHGRIWRNLVFPQLEVVILHLILPRTVSHTLILFVLPEGQEFFAAALMMYCCHLGLALRLGFWAIPHVHVWLTEVRQQIFDDKYLVSTELKNYHKVEAAAALEHEEVKELKDQSLATKGSEGGEGEEAEVS